METADIFFFAGSIYSKISGSHAGQKFIFVVDNRFKLADQFTYLISQNSELIFGCIGNLDVQIPLCHLRSSVFDFKDREFDPAYNYEGEKYSDHYNHNDNRRQKDESIVIKLEALGSRLVTSMFIVGDNVSACFIQRVVKLHTFSVQDCAGFVNVPLFGQRDQITVRCVVLFPGVHYIFIGRPFFFIYQTFVFGKKIVHVGFFLFNILKALVGCFISKSGKNS